MVFEIFTFLFLFFVFLFTFYSLIHDDHLLFRKNISLEKLFNSAFLCGLVFLLSARFFYIFFHFKIQFLNPLVFILFPYYPGMSFVGGLTGAGIWFFFSFQNKKQHASKIFDFFAVSFFSAFVVGMMFQILTNYIFSKTFLFRDMLSGGVSLILFLFILGYFLGKRFKDGTSGFLILVVFSFLTHLNLVMERIEKNSDVFQREDLLVIGLFLFSCVLLLKGEKLLPAIRLWNRK